MIREETPQTLIWFNVFAVMMALISAGGAFLGGYLMTITPAESGLPPDVHHNNAWSMLGIGSLLTILYLAAPFLPRKPWAWKYDVVLIGLGMIYVFSILFAVPLAFAWFREPVKSYFGLESR